MKLKKNLKVLSRIVAPDRFLDDKPTFIFKSNSPTLIISSPQRPLAPEITRCSIVQGTLGPRFKVGKLTILSYLLLES